MNLYAAGVLVAAIFGAGIAADRVTPIIGANARIAHFKHDRDAWRVASDNWQTAATGWEASFRKSEGLRKLERQDAVSAVNAGLQQCDARVRQARASAKVIREIAYAPVKSDAAGCPVRGVVTADRLRDALQARPDR